MLHSYSGSHLAYPGSIPKGSQSRCRAMDQTWHFHTYIPVRFDENRGQISWKMGDKIWFSWMKFPVQKLTILFVFSWMDLCVWKRHVWSIAVLYLCTSEGKPVTGIWQKLCWILDLQIQICILINSNLSKTVNSVAVGGKIQVLSSQALHEKTTYT